MSLAGHGDGVGVNAEVEARFEHWVGVHLHMKPLPTPMGDLKNFLEIFLVRAVFWEISFSTSQLHNEWKCLSIDAKFMISYQSDTD